MVDADDIPALGKAYGLSLALHLELIPSFWTAMGKATGRMGVAHPETLRTIGMGNRTSRSFGCAVEVWLWGGWRPVLVERVTSWSIACAIIGPCLRQR